MSEEKRTPEQIEAHVAELSNWNGQRHTLQLTHPSVTVEQPTDDMRPTSQMTNTD